MAISLDRLYSLLSPFDQNLVWEYIRNVGTGRYPQAK